MATRKSLADCRWKLHSIMRKKEDVMFKRAMIGLSAISVVAMLWTEANAACPFDFPSCGGVGGSEICECYNEGGSIIAVGSIACPTNDPQCIKAPVEFAVELFGNVPTQGAPSCDFNPNCGMRGTLHCDDDEGTPTILFPPHAVPLSPPTVNVAHVAFPLTGKANMDCTSGFCMTSFEIDVNECSDDAANCCRDCCPSRKKHISSSQDTGEKGRGGRKRRRTQNISFTPDAPQAFDARAKYSLNPEDTTGLQAVIRKSADCSLDGNETSTAPKISRCASTNCDLVGDKWPPEAVCTPIVVSCVTTKPEPRPK